MNIAIPQRLRGLLIEHETKIRFLFAGGLNTAFGLAIFPALIWALGDSSHYMIALVVAQILSISFAYMTNKIFVFRTKGNVLREFGRFIGYHAISFWVILGVFPILVEIGKIPPIYAQAGLILGMIATSYLWHSRISFRLRKLDH
ncbi:GtrA family protein [Roseixanthobacter liquoris]|uniref:GtrA family protein n=1 Tax=Roseixanthobacter liquoris TaxID=3119921 RepID=UPI0037266565